jgi:hypothetical protein
MCQRRFGKRARDISRKCQNVGTRKSNEVCCLEVVDSRIASDQRVHRIPEPHASFCGEPESDCAPVSFCRGFLAGQHPLVASPPPSLALRCGLISDFSPGTCRFNIATSTSRVSFWGEPASAGPSAFLKLLGMQPVQATIFCAAESIA